MEEKEREDAEQELGAAEPSRKRTRVTAAGGGSPPVGSWACGASDGEEESEQVGEQGSDGWEAAEEGGGRDDDVLLAVEPLVVEDPRSPDGVSRWQVALPPLPFTAQLMPALHCPPPASRPRAPGCTCARTAHKPCCLPQVPAQEGIASGEELLGWLIGPVDMDTFLEAILEQGPLRVSRPHNPGYYNGLFSKAEVERLLVDPGMQYQYNLDVVRYRGAGEETEEEEEDEAAVVPSAGAAPRQGWGQEEEEGEAAAPPPPIRHRKNFNFNGEQPPEPGAGAWHAPAMRDDLSDEPRCQPGRHCRQAMACWRAAVLMSRLGLWAPWPPAASDCYLRSDAAHCGWLWFCLGRPIPHL